ncbi:tRNA pseudouridine(38-40) synthase TruA [Pseudofulvibacter geojedonensis]|uniref:tRNA pseudouridine synthase A n=1 Tax=Pseudofulvibacter geojedonensis TaxID=1123758 RepID=A0ABW3I099_9FLAO
MRYFIELSYNGKSYHGWQIQPNAISVQEVLEKSLSMVLRKTIQVVGAGRTDAGVHATQIFAHFDVDVEIDQDKIAYKLNALLPKDIAIQRIFRVQDDAHARFHAVKRSYEYKIVINKNAFQYEFTHCVKQALDVGKMNEAAKVLYEYTNFQCFSKVKTDVYTYNCDIYRADWQWRDNTLVFTISADRFLRNMVRAIVGTLLEIGLGRLSIEGLHNIIKSKNRSEAGTSVPGHALYLTEVQYPDTIFYGR